MDIGREAMEAAPPDVIAVVDPGDDLLLHDIDAQLVMVRSEVC